MFTGRQQQKGHKTTRKNYEKAGYASYANGRPELSTVYSAIALRRGGQF